ncbi:MAG: hypothetical protein ACOX1A_07580, partial [Saccharofermentanales bacterium]
PLSCPSGQPASDHLPWRGTLPSHVFQRRFKRKDCICCQAKLRQYAAKHNIDIQGHFLGCYSDELPSRQPPTFNYILMKMNERCDCEHHFSRPAGVCISMYYKGPFTPEGNTAYGVMEEYIKEHRFTALTVYS